MKLSSHPTRFGLYMVFGIFGVITIIKLVFIAFPHLAWYTPTDISTQGNARFICRHPRYDIIFNGMSKSAITHILGTPQYERVKESTTDYTFAQGKLEKSIKEGWTYMPHEWTGSIQVYFDENGKVVGKNCGGG